MSFLQVLEENKYVHGKCTYKKRITNIGEEESIEHSDAPFLAPIILIYDGHIQYNFKNIMIFNNNDLNCFIDNMIEIKEFIKRIESEKTNVKERIIEKSN